MKIIKLNESYDIYNDCLEVLDKLPARAFVVKFAKMRGFYLQEYNIANTNEKIYGQHLKKVEKALRTFKNFDRNLGIILSGKKGIGKSLFAKLLAKESMKNGLPMENEPYQFDIFESGTVNLPRFSYGNSAACIEVSFNPADIIFDPNTGNQIVPAKDLNIEYDFYYVDEDNEKDMKNKEKIKNLIPDFLIIERTRDKQYHYIV